MVWYVHGSVSLSLRSCQAAVCKQFSSPRSERLMTGLSWNTTQWRRQREEQQWWGHEYKSFICHKRQKVTKLQLNLGYCTCDFGEFCAPAWRQFILLLHITESSGMQECRDMLWSLENKHWLTKSRVCSFIYYFLDHFLVEWWSPQMACFDLSTGLPVFTSRQRGGLETTLNRSLVNHRVHTLTPFSLTLIN